MTDHAILVIEDEPVLGKNMLHYLERSGYEVRLATCAMEGLSHVESMHPDVVVLDFNLPDIDGLEALSRIQALQPGTKVVMVTGHGSVELAVNAMRAGASDFLTKPVSLSQLGVRIEQAISDARRDSALRYYQQQHDSQAVLEGLLGVSPPMLAVKHLVQQLLEAEATLRDADPPAVLVLGETGVGKEVVARALHRGGPRRGKPFVELNCATLPAQLLESELFGYERGAFTDARERKLGLVETADGGTLFLDEIGDMDLGAQAKLLKLLEDKTVRRLGSVREQRVSVRIVAATHRPLETLVREGRFRADLYYRLRVVQIALPALRERGEDIILLAEHFLALLAGRYGKPVPTLATSARTALLAHAWPGNVRELRNVLEQAVLMHGDGMLQADRLALVSMHATPSAASVSQGLNQSDETDGLAGTLPEIERQTLLRALRLNGWNVSRAARALGVSRDTLRYRIEKHGLNAGVLPGFTDSQR